MIKSTLRQFIFLLFLFAFCAGTAQAQTVSAGSEVTSPGSAVSVPVEASDLASDPSDLGVVQIVITFDPSVLTSFNGLSNQATRVDGSQVSYSVSQPSPGELKIVYFATNLPDELIRITGGSGALFSMNFDATSTAGTSSALAFDEGSSKLEDSDGNALGATFEDGTVKVNAPPEASFTFSPSTPDTGQDVSFDGSGSSDSDGSIVAYRWDFNDDGAPDETGETVTTSFSDAGPKEVTLTVEDNDGATDSASETVTVNDPPTVSTNAGLTVPVGGSEPIKTSVLSASDPDDSPADLTFTVTSSPTQGELLVNGSAASSFTQQDLENENVGYNHTAGDNTDDSFTFDLTDAEGEGPAGETFTVRVVQNQPPTANDDNYQVQVGQTLEITDPSNGVLGNDSDPEGDPLTASVESGPMSGNLTLNNDGTFTYDPDAGFQGTDSFDYTVSDGRGGTDQATVSIDVFNSDPVARDDEYTISVGTKQLVVEALNGVISNDSDPEGQSLTAALVEGLSGPTGDQRLTFRSDGSFVYEPLGRPGTERFRYAVADGFGGVNQATVTLRTTAVDIRFVRVSAETSGSEAEIQWEVENLPDDPSKLSGAEVLHKAPDAENFVPTSVTIEKSEVNDGSQTFEAKVQELEPGKHQFKAMMKGQDNQVLASTQARATVSMQEAVRLTGPAPHPIRSEASLKFGVKKAQEAQITVYNMLGQQVKTLYRGVPSPGQMQTIQLSTQDLPSGTYFVRLQSGTQSETRQVTVVQ